MYFPGIRTLPQEDCRQVSPAALGIDLAMSPFRMGPLLQVTEAAGGEAGSTPCRWHRGRAVACSSGRLSSAAPVGQADQGTLKARELTFLCGCGQEAWFWGEVGPPKGVPRDFLGPHKPLLISDEEVEDGRIPVSSQAIRVHTSRSCGAVLPQFHGRGQQ